MSKDLVEQKNLVQWTMPAADNEILMALTGGTLISDIDDKSLWQTFKEAITTCYAMSRFTPPTTEELEIITTAVTQIAKYHMGSLRKEEISIAFMRGCMKFYGDYKGLSAITFIDFVRSYLREASRIYLLQPKEITSGPTLEQRFNTAKDNANKAYHDLKSGKDIHLIAGTVFRFLNHLKLIGFSEEEIAEFATQADTEVKATLYAQKHETPDKFKRIDIQRIIDDPLKMEEKIKVHTGRLQLYAYFHQCIRDDVNLDDLIEEKRKEFLK